MSRQRGSQAKTVSSCRSQEFQAAPVHDDVVTDAAVDEALQLSETDAMQKEQADPS